MNSHLESFHLNMTSDEPNDSVYNYSHAMNRSKMLLDEMASSPSKFGNKSTLAFQNATVFSTSLLSNTMVDQQYKEEQQQSSIYTQFKLDTNRFIDDDFNLNDLLKSYANICEEQSHFIHEKLQRLSNTRQKELYNTTLVEQDELEKEKYLWELINVLYTDEQNESSNDNNEMMMTNDENSQGTNEVVIIERLERKNPFLRRIKMIIKWLERIAAQSANLKLVKEKLASFQERCSNWEHTLHHLKSSSSFNRKEKFQSGREFVSELDPDAPIRLNKPLHDLDQEDEYKVMEYIFAFIRAGDLKSARDFCFKIGQSWRAATLEGFKLFKDENFASFERSARQQHELFKNEGNFNRDIWRLMVSNLVKSEQISPYEKAVYGSLAGLVSPVIPVCRTYMDFIWVYFKALYNHIVDRELRHQITVRDYALTPRDTDEDQLFSNLNKSSNGQLLQQIFERIKLLINNSVADGTFANSSASSMSSQLIANLKADYHKPFSFILKHVILSGVEGFKTNTNELMEYLRTVLTSEKQNGSLLRFSSHLALFYRSASFDIKKELFIEIFDMFVEYLIDHKYKEIIAYYLSQLPSDIQVKKYSKFLQDITDNKERMLLLKLAKERNMNVQAITLNIVDNISKKTTPRADRTLLEQSALSTTAVLAKTTEMFTGKTGQVLNDEDKAKINALDWIAYDNMQRFKLLEYANLTMRYFLLERRNFEATKTVFSKVPQDTIAMISMQYNLNQTGGQRFDLEHMIDSFPINVTNAIKEYLCLKDYIEAINLYNEWFEFYHKEKPVEPISKQEGEANQEQSFAERMTHDYQLKQYRDLLERWRAKALLYSEKAKASFISLIKFPFGGWMVDIEANSEENLVDEESSDESNISEENNEVHMNTDDNEEPNQTKKTSKKQRRMQLDALRKLYLPNICFVLLDMLAKMKLNKDLIRLVDLVAGENLKLYSYFDSRQLGAFLNKIADASIGLLDDNADFLGYN